MIRGAAVTAKRTYYDTCALGVYWPASQQCEHCDGESSSLVRVDYLRGRICPVCDGALDEMFEESAVAL